MKDQNQFYPTPPTLARTMWAKFGSSKYARVLEPSAGRGDLLDVQSSQYHTGGKVSADVLDVNLEHHPVLRAKGHKVVGLDFLKYQTPVGYSHIIMNPPFNAGVSHVLHAWELLRNGELVAIINAATVKNLVPAKNLLLYNLIQQYGDVEYIDSAFTDPDTMRKTNVRIALIHLTKKTQVNIPDFSGDMTEDFGVRADVTPRHDLAIPNSSLKNIVVAFDAAVRAMVASAEAEATATYYGVLVQTSLEQTPSVDTAIDYETMQSTVNKRYDSLKKGAWGKVITATDFTSRFTAKVRGEVRDQLADLARMEFTLPNIYAVLEGLLANKTDLDMQAIEEAFDSICRYHDGNRAYYRGWKSNSKHRIGWRIKTTRFILPNMASEWGGLEWRGQETMADIDTAFALLDGKQKPGLSMVQACEQQKTALDASDRVKSDYFELRLFRGTGTMHFFPTRPDLIDRMNRIVGARRQWLPDLGETVPKHFWAAYDKAEKVTAKLRKGHNGWDGLSDEDYTEALGKAKIADWTKLATDNKGLVAA